MTINFKNVWETIDKKASEPLQELFIRPDGDLEQGAAEVASDIAVLFVRTISPYISNLMTKRRVKREEIQKAHTILTGAEEQIATIINKSVQDRYQHQCDVWETELEKLERNLKESKDVDTLIGNITESLKKGSEYRTFFKNALKKFGVESQDELTGDKKKKFFDYVDSNWESDDEIEESISEESLDELFMTPENKKEELVADAAIFLVRVVGPYISKLIKEFNERHCVEKKELITATRYLNKAEHEIELIKEPATQLVFKKILSKWWSQIKKFKNCGINEESGTASKEFVDSEVEGLTGGAKKAYDMGLNHGMNNRKPLDSPDASFGRFGDHYTYGYNVGKNHRKIDSDGVEWHNKQKGRVNSSYRPLQHESVDIIKSKKNSN